MWNLSLVFSSFFPPHDDSGDARAPSDARTALEQGYFLRDILVHCRIQGAALRKTSRSDLSTLGGCECM
jgi:hypothetical protein